MPSAAQEEERYNAVEGALELLEKYPERVFTTSDLFPNSKTGNWRSRILMQLADEGVITRQKDRRRIWIYQLDDDDKLTHYLSNEASICTLAWPSLIQATPPPIAPPEEEHEFEAEAEEDVLDEEEVSPQVVAIQTLKVLVAVIGKLTETNKRLGSIEKEVRELKGIWQ